MKKARKVVVRNIAVEKSNQIDYTHIYFDLKVSNKCIHENGIHPEISILGSFLYYHGEGKSLDTFKDTIKEIFKNDRVIFTDRKGEEV